MDDPLWYRNAIIYEVHVRSFFDSDADGIGDLRGLTQRLDYIEGLGVTALWLLPFYPSPLKDDGYDIAGYTEIHPDYGTLEDFRRFLRQAHRRGLKVITELVLNHTSDQHPWFQRARQAPRGSPERDFYVWSDTTERYKEARIIFPEVKNSNWTFDPVAGQYYWHRFYAHQPDLNFDNPLVRKAVFEVVDFWMNMGIDGLRLDAISYLYERDGTSCESLPETHAFLRDLRAHIDENFSNKMLLAEANQWPEDAVDFFGEGDECHMAFHFPLMPRLFMALEMEDRHPIIDILEQTPDLPEGCRWALFLRNHDELTLEMVTDEERDFMYRAFAPELRMRVNLGIRRRLASMLRGDLRKIKLMNAMLLSLPGTPIIYYGDEIGMGDNYHLGDRDGVRTPMQWSADRNAGFSRANPQSLFLPVVTDPAYHYLSTNVETQENNSSSLLSWLKRLISIRKRTPALAEGELEFIPCSNHRVLAFVRSTEESTILVVLNLSRAARHLHLDLSQYASTWPVELWGRTQFPPVEPMEAHRYPLSLGPYGSYWFELAPEPVKAPVRPESIEPGASPLEVREEWTEIFEGRLRAQFLTHLMTFLDGQDWFNPRSRRVDIMEIDERLRLRWDDSLTVVCMLEVRYLDGNNELYVLPLEFASEPESHNIRSRATHAVVADLAIQRGERKGILYDATSNPAFANALLNFIRKGWKLNGLEGDFHGHWLEQFQDVEPDVLDALSTQVVEVNHSHTTLAFGEQVVMKLFRRLDRGLSVDVEVGKYLQECGFDGAAPLMGHLDYRRGRMDPTTLATVNAFIPHQSSAWNWYVNHCSSWLQDQNSGTATLPPRLSSANLLSGGPLRLVGESKEMLSFLDQTRQLGRRTASLHRALARAPAESPFAPLPLNPAYERARYQSMRTLSARTFRLLRRKLADLDQTHDLARWVLEHESIIRERFLALVGQGFGGMRIRIHGDYHLEEVLFTGDDFIITDFEGHPWLPIGERRIKRSSLRDVAAMTRSFHHACLVTLREHLTDHEISENHPLHLPLFHRSQIFYAATASALFQGYLEDRSQMFFLPSREESMAVLLDALRLKMSLQQLRHSLERNEDPTIAMMGMATLLMGDS